MRVVEQVVRARAKHAARARSARRWERGCTILVADPSCVLLEVERGWRDMKTTLDLRPVRHRKEDRIRAHVILCWLALLLIRIAETQTAQTWRNLRDELQRMHLGTFTGPAGTSRQRTEITARQRDILRALGVPDPPLFLALAAAEPAASQPPDQPAPA